LDWDVGFLSQEHRLQDYSEQDELSIAYIIS